MMTELVLQTAEVFKPLDQPSRYKGAYGGRGSGKSWDFVSMVVERCLLKPGTRIACIREIQKTLAQSAKLLIENKIQELGVGSEFRVLFDRIETPGGGLLIFLGMQDQNAESIKSLEGYDVAWVRRLKLNKVPWNVAELVADFPLLAHGRASKSLMLVLWTCNVSRTKALNPPTKHDYVRRRNAMLKTLLIAASAAALALTPAYAGASKECTDEHMKEMGDMIAKMTDAAKKEEATSHLDMSKAAMKKGDTAGCMKHMDEAHKAMGVSQ